MIRTEKMNAIATDLTRMILDYGRRNDITVTYAKLTDEDMAKFSDFAIRYHQLHKGEEMFLIWENIPDKNPGLLYAVNVTADSYLTAMQEAIDLIARKF